MKTNNQRHMGRFTICLPPEVVQELRKQAASDKQSMSAWACHALEKALRNAKRRKGVQTL